MHVVACLRSTYLDRLAEEVNDKLQEAGLITLAELCKSYDLPGDFLSEVCSRKSQSASDIHDDEDEDDEDAMCVSPTSGVVQAARQPHPRRDGSVQQGRHLHAGFRLPTQGEDPRALQRHHKVRHRSCSLGLCASVCSSFQDFMVAFNSSSSADRRQSAA